LRNLFQIIQSNYLQDKIGNNKKYVLFLGRLSNVKDVEFLIKLWSKKFQKNNEIKLVIAGTGEDDDRLKLLVNKICVTNKPLFIGEIRPTNIPKIISSANMCILSSFHEASPTVIKESLSSGIPIITNNIGDVENFIVNNKNGFIVEKNIESYYNSILSLTENPIQKEDVLKYSENQLKKSSNSFVSDQFIKIYKTLI
jgi:glycosyltransferase involved in cell wall biosynthesis